MKKIKLRYPLLVEGSYDKNRILAVAEGTVITTNGFGVFNSTEKKALLRRITESGKLLVLTDSDGAGMLIRNKLKGYLPAENVINLYSPTVKGKEKRKKSPSKEGILGVEGMSDEVLRNLLAPYSTEADAEPVVPVTTAILYSAGLTGGKDSSALRASFCRKASLPESLSPKAFREAINLLGGVSYFEKIIAEIEK